MQPDSNDVRCETLIAEVAALQRQLGELTARLNAAEDGARARPARWPIVAAGLLIAVAAIAQTASPLTIDKDTGVVRVLRLMVGDKDVTTALNGLDSRLTKEASRLTNEASRIDDALARISRLANVVEDGAARSRALQTQVNDGARFILAPPKSCPTGWYRIGAVGLIMAESDFSKTPFGKGGDFGSGWKWTHPDLCQKS